MNPSLSTAPPPPLRRPLRLSAEPLVFAAVVLLLVACIGIAKPHPVVDPLGAKAVPATAVVDAS